MLSWNDVAGGVLYPCLRHSWLCRLLGHLLMMTPTTCFCWLYCILQGDCHLRKPLTGSVSSRSQTSCLSDAAPGAGQVVLSHTPFRQLADQYGQRPVLVAGRKQTAEVALTYGFESAVTTCELAAAFPHSVPFSLSVDGAPSCRKKGRQGKQSKCKAHSKAEACCGILT